MCDDHPATAAADRQQGARWKSARSRRRDLDGASAEQLCRSDRVYIDGTRITTAKRTPGASPICAKEKAALRAVANPSGLMVSAIRSSRSKSEAATRRRSRTLRARPYVPLAQTPATQAAAQTVPTPPGSPGVNEVLAITNAASCRSRFRPSRSSRSLIRGNKIVALGPDVCRCRGCEGELTRRAARSIQASSRRAPIRLNEPGFRCMEDVQEMLDFNQNSARASNIRPTATPFPSRAPTESRRRR